MLSLCLLSVLVVIQGSLSPQAAAQHPPKIYDPPPREHLNDSRRCRQEYWMRTDPTYNCLGSRYVKSQGYFRPCNQHKHCYEAREPSDWCVLPHGFRWSNWGCHCDFKFNSCVIERWNGRARRMEWGYCSPKPEFVCERTRLDAFVTRVRG